MVRQFADGGRRPSGTGPRRPAFRPRGTSELVADAMASWGGGEGIEGRRRREGRSVRRAKENDDDDHDAVWSQPERHNHARNEATTEEELASHPLHSPTFGDAHATTLARAAALTSSGRDRTSGRLVQPSTMELAPPGALRTRVVGRSESMFPAFGFAPEAHAFDDVPTARAAARDGSGSTTAATRAARTGASGSATRATGARAAPAPRSSPNRSAKREAGSGSGAARNGRSAREKSASSRANRLGAGARSTAAGFAAARGSTAAPRMLSRVVGAGAAARAGRAAGAGAGPPKSESDDAPPGGAPTCACGRTRRARATGSR